MKLLLLSDLHLMWERPVARLDDVSKTSFRKMAFVFDYAFKSRAVVLQAGDFFDKPRSWHMLVAYIKMFNIYKEVPVYCVFGQHDQYFRSKKDTLLDSMSAAGYINILGEKHIDIGSGVPALARCLLYGCGYEETVPKPENENEFNVLVAHRMVLAEKLWSGQEDYEHSGRFLKKHSGYDLILCGDAHQTFIGRSGTSQKRTMDKQRIICNAGPMMRGKVNLWHHKPGFWFYDTDDWSIEWVEIPHQSPEEVLTRKHLDAAEEAKHMLEHFVDGIKTLHPEMEGFETNTHFADNLAKYLEDHDLSDKVAAIISEEMERSDVS